MYKHAFFLLYISVMEVACGEHGDYVQKLVAAVDAGKCTNFLELTSGTNGKTIANDISKETKPLNPNAPEGPPVPNGYAKATTPTCTTSLLDSTEENLPQIDKTGFPTSGWLQFWILLKRTIATTLRDKALTRMRLAAHFVIGILLGLIYYDIGNNAAKVMSNAGCIFFTVMFTMFTAMMPTILTCKLRVSNLLIIQNRLVRPISVKLISLVLLAIVTLFAFSYVIAAFFCNRLYSSTNFVAKFVFANGFLSNRE